jgi:SAM-dependent methyltransferase
MGGGGRDGIVIDICPLCDGRAFRPHRSGATGVEQCATCGVGLRNPQPSDVRLSAIYGPDYFFGAGDHEMEAATSALKSATADLYLEAIHKYLGTRRTGLRLLDVGCGHGDLLARARARHYDVHGTDVSADAVRRVEARLGRGTATQGDPEALPPAAVFDVCVLSDVIEHARDPVLMLRAVSRILRPGGTLFISTPSIAHWSARLLGRHWMEFKEEHLFYFDPRTIRRLLDRCGYHDVVVGPGFKRLNLDYITAHFRRFHVPLIGPALSASQRLLPAVARRRALSLPTGGIVVMARRGADS